MSVGVSARAGGQQQGYGTQQLLWRLVPAAGVLSEYTLCPGEETVLGRFDMVQQSPFVSRKQCEVQIAADGSATLASIGKPSTLLRRAGQAAPWYVLRRAEDERPIPLSLGLPVPTFGPCVLSNGDQISLDCHNPESAVFTIVCQDEGAASGGGYDAAQMQYSDDGQWLWNGAEWVPAR